jgi:hypothetical protein
VVFDGICEQLHISKIENRATMKPCYHVLDVCSRERWGGLQCDTELQSFPEARPDPPVYNRTRFYYQDGISDNIIIMIMERVH